ncbi:MAG: hypothetical protein LUC43_07400 [Burkholderiales bacterium]|nr:hypothetical protein [Burkholderiales bacterium]
MPDQTTKTENAEHPDDAVEVVTFDYKARTVFFSNIKKGGGLIPRKIPFNALEAKPGQRVTLVFPFKDGTKLNFELPPKMEKDATVVFKIDPLGDGIEKTNFSGMAADKHIIDTQCAGWFRLKERKDPTVSLKFSSTYPDPFLPYQIEVTEIATPTP